MARIYKDGNGSYYDGTNNKFVTTPFGKVLPAGKSSAADLVDADPLNPGRSFIPFNFGSATSFAQKADNGIAGEMRDCGECHVGGGFMEYIMDPAKAAGVDAAGNPAYSPAKRTSLRDYVFGAAYTGWNALIDIFNTTPANRGNVITQDYKNVNGVLEMDCLICHQSGYDWTARKQAIRKGEFDASRALGAGFANSAVNGVTVFYNATTVKANASGELVVDLSKTLNAKPQSEQCNSCHQGVIDGTHTELKYQVEWKKRGEVWTAVETKIDPVTNLPYLAKVQTEVHSSIGCMGCHERKADAEYGTTGLTSEAKLGLCDPAKGGDTPFEAMWNQLDNKQFKNCAGCHEPTTAEGGNAIPTFNTYGAPASQAAHERAGLTAKIAYDKNDNKISHMDLIDCTACHVRKGAWSGGAMVDGTGADEEGRVAIHDTEHVAKTDMSNGTAYKWGLDGKIHSVNLLTSFYWRDMNGLGLDYNTDGTVSSWLKGGLDINLDGRTAGMDPVLPTHMNNVNIANGLHGITEDGVVTASEINKQKSKMIGGLNNVKTQLGLPAEVDINPGSAGVTNPFIPKISFMVVPFKTPHNIATAKNAFGVNGCTDCHSPNKGFYNGAYPINGKMQGTAPLTSAPQFFNFSSNQVAALSKVNGLVEVTDSHPNVINKKATRSVPIPLLSKFDGPTATATATVPAYLRNIDRSEVLYEKTFQTIDETWYNGANGEFIQGGAIADACKAASPFYCATVKVNASDADGLTALWKRAATSTAGWTMKIEVMPAAGGAITTRTAMITSPTVADVAGIISALPASFVTNSDFTVSAVGNTIKITPAADKKVRISKQSDVGPFGLAGKLWKADPIVRGAQTFYTRDEYVLYLNSLTDKAAFGLGVAPTAAISTVNGASVSGGTTAAAVEKGAVVTLQAATPVANNTATYKWYANAGATFSNDAIANPTVTFNKSGLWRVTLKVTAADGKVVQATQRIMVTDPAVITFPGAVVSTINAMPTTQGSTTPVSVTGITVKAGTVYDYARVIWGDGSTSSKVNAPFTGLSHDYVLQEKYKTVSSGKWVYTYRCSVQLIDEQLVAGVTKKVVTGTITVPVTITIDNPPAP